MRGLDRTGGDKFSGAAGAHPETKMEAKVAIVGAGLGGLALAIGLHRRGIEAHVFEKGAGFETSKNGTAMSLSFNASRALDGILDGLSYKMKEVSSMTRSIKSMVSAGKGPFVVTENTPAEGSIYVIKWMTARELLADLVPSSYIHFSHRLVTYTRAADGNAVDLAFEVAGDKGATTVRAEFVVGADGINSATRKIMIGDEPRDLHMINWFALVHNPDSRNFRVHEKDQICFIRKNTTLSMLLDAGEGYTLWVFRMEDHSEDRPPVKIGGTTAKSQVLQEVDKLIEDSEVWKPVRTAVEATDPDIIYERRVRDRLPLNSWSGCDGRVLLIGDAAHAMYSGPGQGARTAFEDAHQLMELMVPAFSTAETSGETIKQLVASFEETRVPRLAKFQSFAADATGIPEFMSEVSKTLSPQQRVQRMQEFSAWVSSYPNKMRGDPDSTYFK